MSAADSQRRSWTSKDEDAVPDAAGDCAPEFPVGVATQTEPLPEPLLTRQWGLLSRFQQQWISSGDHTPIQSLEAHNETQDGTASTSPSSSVVSQDAPPTSPYSAIIATIFEGGRGADRRIVLFVSSEAGAGVTRTASEVAGELAAGGRKVLLADAAVIAAFSSEATAVSLCERAGADHIWVLGAKQTRRTRRDLGQHARLPSATLDALSQEFPYIVLDAPALKKGDAALRLAGSVETILVVRRGRTETRAAVKACKKIADAGGSVLGCVYNDY